MANPNEFFNEDNFPSESFVLEGLELDPNEAYTVADDSTPELGLAKAVINPTTDTTATTQPTKRKNESTDTDDNDNKPKKKRRKKKQKEKEEEDKFVGEGPVFSLVYISTANVETGVTKAADVTELLRKARLFNFEKSITGMLILITPQDVKVDKHYFMQLLEGKQHDVEPLYQRIQNDKRHREVTTLFKGDVEYRYFTKWAMAFTQVPDKKIAKEQGFTKFEYLKLMLSTSVRPTESSSHPALSMFRTFGISLLTPKTRIGISFDKKAQVKPKLTNADTREINKEVTT